MRRRIAKLQDGYAAGVPIGSVLFALASAALPGFYGFDLSYVLKHTTYGPLLPVVWGVAAIFLWLGLNVAVCAVFYGGQGLFLSRGKLILLNPLWFAVPVDQIERIELPPGDPEQAKRPLLLHLAGGRIRRLPVRLLAPIAIDLAECLKETLGLASATS